MIEGWNGDEYLILFEERAAALDRSYGVSVALPGYRLIGLRGWDDFIVEDSAGVRFAVPTVPLLQEHLVPFEATATSSTLEPDAKVQGRVKWYITPLVFGGDPKLGENVTWITLDQHAQLVSWWNRKYHDVKAGRGTGSPEIP